MPSDIHLKLGDIKGESPDDKHKDEIEVIEWGWGIAQPSTMHAGGGGGEGQASFQDLRLTHHVDKASPNIMAACATGEHIKEAKLTMRKAGKGQQEYLMVTMSDVMVTGVEPTGNGSGGARPVETVRLAFSKVDLEYKPQKADGSLDAGIHFKYDIKARKAE